MTESKLIALVAIQKDKIERWELYRLEMQNHEQRLAKLAASFLEIPAYEDAAKCAIKAEGIKYVLGRMPLFDNQI